MSTFDQRGQRVMYQYNTAGDINFGAVHDRINFSMGALWKNPPAHNPVPKSITLPYVWWLT